MEEPLDLLESALDMVCAMNGADVVLGLVQAASMDCAWFILEPRGVV